MCKGKSGYNVAKEPGVSVDVNVDVTQIIKYLCITGVLIVGIIFGIGCLRKVIETKSITKGVN